MSRKARSHSSEFVEPDLPIIPMLDMSFQLMAFFIITFRPMPTEGQLALALPDLQGGAKDVATPSIENEKEEDVTVIVDATGDGEVKNVSFTDSTGTQPNLGADLKNYQKALIDKVKNTQKDKKKIGKLKLEIDPGLLQAHVVQLIDIAFRAGFTDIGPEPKRAGGAPK